MTRKQTAPQHIAKRARIILLANEHAETNQAIADALGTGKEDVTRWTKRWIDRAAEPVLERLSDLPRPKHPDVITPEQWCQIIAMACEPPEKYGRPITHWSSTELAAEAVKQGIVESLSPGRLRKVLQKKDLQPHRSRYWLNAKADEKKEERIADICALYQKAADQVDEITLSVDEMTGIQALERIAEELPISEGKPVAREFEYKRHGTQTLTAAIRVAFGTVYAHCGDTRTEADFSRFIEAFG